MQLIAVLVHQKEIVLNLLFLNNFHKSLAQNATFSV